jgi:DNA-binding response OmpR family regulator
MQHLLVVDDDPAVARTMQMALEADAARRVTAAGDAMEALAVIGRDFPDAAIIDAVLPRTPGLLLARTVVDLGVPVLIVTGEPTLPRHLAEAGCPFLLKPFRVSQLLAETRMLLDETAARRLEVGRALDRLLTARYELAEVTAETRRLVEESRRFRAQHYAVKAVARYHMHFVDHVGRVFDSIELEGDADDPAIEETRRLDVPSIGAGFDVWHEGRLVHRHRR